MRKRILSIAVIVCMIFTMAMPTIAMASENEISIYTTLTDGATYKGSKKTIDVIARLNDEKIDSSVTLNGEPVAVNWDDGNKTSFTIVFKNEGENKIDVTAKSGSLEKKISYTVYYEKAKEGDLIGYATWSLEALTIGQGFLHEPIKAPIYEGECAAQALDRLLTEGGYSYAKTGGNWSSFYLSIVASGGKGKPGDGLKYGCTDAEKGTALDIPKDIGDFVPSVLKEVLDKDGIMLEEAMYVDDDGVYGLGEFDFTYMSGWMYSINNVFPNVGFGNSYLTDGDVVRVQFTLYGYGADIGGGYSMGGSGNTDFYSVANKNALMSALADVNSAGDKEDMLAVKDLKSAWERGTELAEKLDAEQDAVDKAASELETEILRYLGDKEAAAAVTEKIESIGEVTLDSEDKIKEARAAYDALNTVGKTMVKNYEKLTKAEEKLTLLKADVAAVAAVTEKIESIGEVTLDSENKIKEARAAYDALSTERKAMVKNYDTLIKAEEKLAALKANAEKTEENEASGVPKTGDEAELTLLMLLAALSANAYIFISRKKDRMSR